MVPPWPPPAGVTRLRVPDPFAPVQTPREPYHPTWFRVPSGGGRPTEPRGGLVRLRHAQAPRALPVAPRRPRPRRRLGSVARPGRLLLGRRGPWPALGPAFPRVGRGAGRLPGADDLGLRRHAQPAPRGAP